MEDAHGSPALGAEQRINFIYFIDIKPVNLSGALHDRCTVYSLYVSSREDIRKCRPLLEIKVHLLTGFLNINSRTDPDRVRKFRGIPFLKPYSVAVHRIGPCEQDEAVRVSVFPVGGV